MALVIPESGLAKMNIDDMVNRVSGTQLDVAYFANLEEARVWLIAGDRTSPWRSLTRESVPPAGSCARRVLVVPRIAVHTRQP